jgi:hypothetical protein
LPTSAPTTVTTSASTITTPDIRIEADDGTYLVFNNDIVIYNQSGSVIWRTNVTGSTVTSKPDGTLQIINSNGTVLWPSAGSQTIQLIYGQYYLLNGTTALWGTKGGNTVNGTTITTTNQTSVLTASDGSYLLFGDDFVIYNASGSVIWRANITGATTYIQNSNGSFLVLDKNGIAIWPKPGETTYMKAINGQFVLVNGTTVLWGSSDGNSVNNSTTSATTNLGTTTQSSSAIATSTVASTIASTQVPSTTAAPTTSTTDAPTNPPFDPTSYPCGTFMKYDPVNQVNFPELYGVVGGQTNNMTSGVTIIEYVGYGNVSCGGLLPGYIKTSSPAGAVISCQDGKQFDDKDAYFLLKHPNLQWVNTSSTNISSVQNILGVKGQSSNVFGRFFYYYMFNYQLGRVQVETGIGLYYLNERDGQYFTSTGFQVLTCVPSSTTQALTDPPITTTTETTTVSSTTTSSTTEATTNPPFDSNLQPCGTFMKYDPINQRNYPELYGFAGGLDYDMTTIEYVGYGNVSCGLQPGYIRVSTPVGAIISCPSGRQVDEKNAYFLLKNANLQWVDTDYNNIIDVPNILRIDGQSEILFGRLLVNNQYQLGRIYIRDAFNYILDGTYQEGYSTTFQVLTCTPSSTPQASTTILEAVTTSVVASSPTEGIKNKIN